MNTNYSAVQHVAFAGARSGGYTRIQDPLVDVKKVTIQVPPAAKTNLGKFAGDLLTEMRILRQAEPTTLQAWQANRGGTS